MYIVKHQDLRILKIFSNVNIPLLISKLRIGDRYLEKCTLACTLVSKKPLSKFTVQKHFKPFYKSNI